MILVSERTTFRTRIRLGRTQRTTGSRPGAGQHFSRWLLRGSFLVHRFNLDNSASISFKRLLTSSRSPSRNRWNGSAIKSSQTPRHESAHLIPLIIEEEYLPIR